MYVCVFVYMCMCVFMYNKKDCSLLYCIYKVLNEANLESGLNLCYATGVPKLDGFQGYRDRTMNVRFLIFGALTLGTGTHATFPN